VNGALGTWVPPDVLIGLLCLVIGLLYKLVLDRAKKTENTLDELKRAIVDLDKRFVSAATLQHLGSMGDRLDGRITNVAQEIAVLKAVVGERNK
jgi:hypothetical protein